MEEGLGRREMYGSSMALCYGSPAGRLFNDHGSQSAHATRSMMIDELLLCFPRFPRRPFRFRFPASIGRRAPTPTLEADGGGSGTTSCRRRRRRLLLPFLLWFWFWSWSRRRSNSDPWRSSSCSAAPTAATRLRRRRRHASPAPPPSAATAREEPAGPSLFLFLFHGGAARSNRTSTAPASSTSPPPPPSTTTTATLSIGSEVLQIYHGSIHRHFTSCYQYYCLLLLLSQQIDNSAPRKFHLDFNFDFKNKSSCVLPGCLFAASNHSSRFISLQSKAIYGFSALPFMHSIRDFSSL